MFHGRYAWRHQLKAFKQSFKVVALDLRGFGFSDAPAGRKNYEREAVLEDIQGVIEALGCNEENGETRKDYVGRMVSSRASNIRLTNSSRNNLIHPL